MTQVAVERWIEAPASVIFKAVAEVEHLPATNPDIVRVDFEGDQKTGVGTRFKETRRMGKKEMVTALEITEWVDDERVRMVADSHGTVWDTVFTVTPEGDGARLKIAMDARAHKLLPKLMNPIFKGMFRKGMDKHIAQLKAHLEERAPE